MLKHAVKTIIHTLEERDRFSLISYSDDARVEFDLMSMTKENREQALLALEKL